MVTSLISFQVNHCIIKLNSVKFISKFHTEIYSVLASHPPCPSAFNSIENQRKFPSRLQANHQVLSISTYNERTTHSTIECWSSSRSIARSFWTTLSTLSCNAKPLFVTTVDSHPKCFSARLCSSFVDQRKCTLCSFSLSLSLSLHKEDLSLFFDFK